MKKGFTLVELLAVIVILSIIAIITIPMISNVIEKSKLGAMEDSAYGLIEAANYYYAEHMNEMSSNKLFVIENGVQTSEEKLNYKGKIEGNAKILLASNGKVALCLTNGKSYAKKEITDSKVIMNTVSSDTTCEINGIDNDSDITIDISGGNSSYYDKVEIDDKLNDIRTDLSDLSSTVSNNTKAIDNLNVRYNKETDMIEIFYNGVWNEWKIANMQTYYLYKDGKEDILFSSDGYSHSSPYGAWNQIGFDKDEKFMYTYPINDSTGGYIGTVNKVDLTDYNTLYFDVDFGNNSKTYTLDISTILGEHHIAVSYKMNDQQWVAGFHITSGIGDLRLITEKGKYTESMSSNPMRIRRIYMK